MKKRNLLISAAMVVMLMLNYAVKGQVLTINNSNPCDVTVGYEMRDNNTTACNVCSGGTLLVKGGTSGVTIPLCAGAIDICIWVVDVDGESVGYNHQTFSCFMTLSPCCQICVPGGGFLSTSAPNCPGQPWGAVLSAGFVFSVF